MCAGEAGDRRARWAVPGTVGVLRVLEPAQRLQHGALGARIAAERRAAGRVVPRFPGLRPGEDGRDLDVGVCLLHRLQGVRLGRRGLAGDSLLRHIRGIAHGREIHRHRHDVDNGLLRLVGVYRRLGNIHRRLIFGVRRRNVHVRRGFRLRADRRHHDQDDHRERRQHDRRERRPQALELYEGVLVFAAVPRTREPPYHAADAPEEPGLFVLPGGDFHAVFFVASHVPPPCGCVQMRNGNAKSPVSAHGGRPATHRIIAQIRKSVRNISGG